MKSNFKASVNEITLHASLISYASSFLIYAVLSINRVTSYSLPMEIPSSVPSAIESQSLTWSSQ
jgi:hypothetical protein